MADIIDEVDWSEWARSGDAEELAGKPVPIEFGAPGPVVWRGGFLTPEDLRREIRRELSRVSRCKIV